VGAVTTLVRRNRENNHYLIMWGGYDLKTHVLEGGNQPWEKFAERSVLQKSSFGPPKYKETIRRAREGKKRRK